MFELTQSLVEQTGYFGISMLMLVENIFPPIPSELIMPLAGFTAERGQLNIVLVVLAGTAGSLAGALFWYGVARWLGSDRLKIWAERHGRWLTMAPRDVDSAMNWFERNGRVSVLVGRLIPGVRSLISIPAGFSRMTLRRFLAYSVVGTAIWTAGLAMAGYLLGAQYERVSDWVNPVSNVVVGGLVVWYLYRVITFKP